MWLITHIGRFSKLPDAYTGSSRASWDGGDTGPYIFDLFTGQIMLMDRFFDGTFLTYGIEVISYAERDQEDRIDPMVYIFPRMTKCLFHKFGRSGEIERHDAMCILPLNIMNEKIYIFLWFWFALLLVLTFLLVISRFFIILR